MINYGQIRIDKEKLNVIYYIKDNETKPMSKKSKYCLLFSESCRWCECGNNAILNGLTRVERKTEFCQVMSNGISIRYQASIYDCI